MHGKSSRTRVVSIRLRNETIAKIERALDSPANPNASISDYCKTVVERWVWRHVPKLECVRCNKVLLSDDDRAAGKCYDCVVIDNDKEEGDEQ